MDEIAVDVIGLAFTRGEDVSVAGTVGKVVKVWTDMWGSKVVTVSFGRLGENDFASVLIRRVRPAEDGIGEIAPMYSAAI